MTIRGTESAFGAPESQWEAQLGRRIADGTDKRKGVSMAEDAAPENDVKWVNTELHAIASTIETLQNRLEQANSRLSKVGDLEAKEVEIGRLFVEAQRFVESYLSKIDIKIHQVLSEAEAKARQILVEATEEARGIREDAQHAAFASTSTIRELQSAIAGFTTVNAELLNELGTLNSMLSPRNDRRSVQSETSSATAISSTELG